MLCPVKLLEDIHSLHLAVPHVPKVLTHVRIVHMSLQTCMIAYTQMMMAKMVTLYCVGNSTAWLFPFVDGQPPIGWEDAARYLVLPVLLVRITLLILIILM